MSGAHLAIRHITVDCTGDPYEVAEFWAAATGHPLHPDDQPGDPEASVRFPEGQPSLLFIQVPEDKAVKNRLHLDLQPERPRDEEVARLTGLGATVLADHRQPDGRGWVTLADPMGNEFCVVRSAAERAAWHSRFRREVTEG